MLAQQDDDEGVGSNGNDDVKDGNDALDFGQEYAG